MSKQKRLTNLDYQDPAYWQDAPQTNQPQTKRGELVKPFPPPVTAKRYEPITVDMNVPQQSIMAVNMTTTAVDRAQGFTIETHQLSMVTGVLAVIVAVVFFDHPFLALGTLWIFFVWYTLVWLAAWLFHRVVSPEGLAFFNAIMTWRYINRRG